jgi:hypothetical protein
MRQSFARPRGAGARLEIEAVLDQTFATARSRAGKAAIR